ncbi:hypothetical protein [Sphingomicrobium astaxanthinifaciens]|uniref:hypothetical protein n=1 Tax=Sphingomicrobium astaxanthinifaciens TaxID=1227949 RepID=UPI001FCA819C|nr:hypothetical protein [Sphingomicrobium astaxanthinifaciens]MCJ7422299.1 hypothetical protein [Sphingomicrobium astaxanthinifaciens]
MTDKKTSKATPAPSAASTSSNRKAYKTAGVAVGVGSAAIVAALLYANRRKKAKAPKAD